MAGLQEHVAYLSQEIGPRPAGTEEEQQAASYIADALQSEANLPASIEEFNCNPGYEIVSIACCALSAILAIVSLFVSEVVIAALVVSALCAVVYLIDALVYPLSTRLFSQGVSQNVVARFEPQVPASRKGIRQRKVVLVAHYDTGRVRRELKSPILSAVPILRWAELAGVVLVPVLILLRFVTGGFAALSAVLLVLLVVAVVLTLLPLVRFAAYSLAPYNDAANCNASGVAVMIGLAQRIQDAAGAPVAMSSDDQEAVYHGQEEAVRQGLVPPGAEFAYEVDATALTQEDVGDSSQLEGTSQDRLLAAKAAVAALSGQPVSQTVNIDLPEEAASGVENEGERALGEQQASGQDGLAAASEGVTIVGDVAQASVSASSAPVAQVAQASGAVAGAPAELGTAGAFAQQTSSTSSTPEWFKSAQEKARKSAAANAEPKAPRRSRYADALDAAVRESRSHFEAANQVVQSEAALRLQHMRESITEVKAPGFEDDDFLAAVQPAVPPAARSFQGSASEDSSEAAVRAIEGQPIPHEASGHDEQAVSAAVSLPATSSVSERACAADGNDMRVHEPVDHEEDAAALMDKTIAFIPVALDDQSMQAQPGQCSSRADEASGNVSTADKSAAEQHPRKKRAISLPSLTGSLDPVGEAHKQRAPLAEGVSTPTARSQMLRNALPAIGNAGVPAAEEDAHARVSSLRASLPSLSGVIAAQNEDAQEGAESTGSAGGNVSQVGSFASLGATGAFSPVGDELLEDVAPEDIYVDDADDSAYEEGYTQTGAFAGPGYVDMPTSRVSRFFDRFHFGGKKKERASSTNEWLGVDDNFEARSVGAARGGWESFREDDDAAAAPQGSYAGVDDGYDDYDSYDDESYDGYDDYEADQPDLSSDRAGRWNGGAFSQDILDRVGYREESHEYAEHMDQINGFRNSGITTEVWFVALGSEYARNAGMAAFLEEHAEELRGAIIIDLEGLGAGELTLIGSEGVYRSVKVSARMKRYVRKAASTLKRTVGAADLPWFEGASVYATRKGHQAMHLVGMKDGKPAGYAEAGDTCDIVDEKTLNRNADFLLELIRGI